MLRSVLVPHDLSPPSDHAIGTALRFEAPVQQLHAVHVLRRIDLTNPGLIWPREEDEARREHALSQLQLRLMGLGAEHAVTHVKVGDPATRIVELAREIGASLIVMASHGRTGMTRLVMGSVAEHVVRFASCPVLVLPSPVSGTLGEEPRGPTSKDRSPEEQLDAVACVIIERVAGTSLHLSAARIAIPAGRGMQWWDSALVARLGTSGIEFVDLVLEERPYGPAEILDLRFEGA